MNFDEKIIVCEETLNIWMQKFKDEGKDLKEEIENVKGTISNERIWQMGSSTDEEINNHTQNIINLTAYLEWLEDQI